jgi:hypothetical protein
VGKFWRFFPVEGFAVIRHVALMCGMSDNAISKASARTDLLGDYDRNLKQELRRNKKFRFRKSDKRRRAEKWISPCSV